MNGFRISDFGLRNTGDLPRSRGIRNPQSAIRNAFTLIELLITITIFLILVGMTIAVVGVAFDGERLSSGAQRVHSYLGGARDRAVYAGAPRGVRFMVDPNLTEGTTYAVTSMIYIQQLLPEEGVATVTTSNSVTLNASTASTYQDLKTAGLLGPTFARIRLADSSGLGGELTDDNSAWYPAVLPADLTSDPITLVKAYPFPAATVLCEIELGNGVLPNSEPVQLPNGIMIHVNDSTSQLTDTAANIASTGFFDVMFSPRGSVTGSAASQGILQLVVCDVADVPEGKVSAYFGGPSQATFDAVEGGMRVVTVFTRTGQTTSNELDPDAPFLYALTGEVTEE